MQQLPILINHFYLRSPPMFLWAMHFALRFHPILLLQALSVGSLLVDFVCLICDLQPKINLFRLIALEQSD